MPRSRNSFETQLFNLYYFIKKFMPYRPKFCCQCGDKIERPDRKFWDSRRFCELCETDYRIYDLMPYITGIGLLLIVLTISFYFQKNEKPLNVMPNQLASIGSSGAKNIAANQSVAPALNVVQTSAQTNVKVTPVESPSVLKTSETKNKPANDSTGESSEKVYFCGAATKKGTPCSRRVRGGGRCWQHAGQPAMLTQDKLIASQ